MCNSALPVEVGASDEDQVLAAIRNRLSDYQAEHLCDLLGVPSTPIEDALAFLKKHLGWPR